MEMAVIKTCNALGAVARRRAHFAHATGR